MAPCMATRPADVLPTAVSELVKGHPSRFMANILTYGTIVPRYGIDAMGLADFMLSKRQQAILAPLLMHPGKTFGTVELIRKSGQGRGAGQVQIRKLLDAGVLKASRVGNQQRIEINSAFPLYEELRSLCRKSFGLAEAVRDALAPFAADIVEAFIFGSVATGKDSGDSDVDLMIVGTADFLELQSVMLALEKNLSRPVHLTLYSPDEWQVVQSDPILEHIVASPRLQVLP